MVFNTLKGLKDRVESKRTEGSTDTASTTSATPAEPNIAIYFTIGSLAPALISSSLLAIRAYRRKSLTPGGCAAGFAVGMITTNVGGIVPTIALYNFFITSTWLTKIGAETKRRIAMDLGGAKEEDNNSHSAEIETLEVTPTREEDGNSSPDVAQQQQRRRDNMNKGRDEELVYHKAGNRNAWQVLSNGGVACTFLLIYFAKQWNGCVASGENSSKIGTSLSSAFPSSWINWLAVNDKAIMMAVVAHYAAAIGDTYSSEVGVLSGMGARVWAGQSKTVRRVVTIVGKCANVVSCVGRFIIGSEQPTDNIPTKSPQQQQNVKKATKNYARLILGGRAVPKGTNGGVSWLGTASAVAGGVQLAIVIALLTAPMRKDRDPLRTYVAPVAPKAPTHTPDDPKRIKQLKVLTERCSLIFKVLGVLLSPVYAVVSPMIIHAVRVRDLFWVCPAAALVGTVVDSILGQLFQASYATRQAVYEAESSHRHTSKSNNSDDPIQAPENPDELVHVSGIALLTNNQVNAVSLIIVSVATFAYFKAYDGTVDGVVGKKDSKVKFAERIMQAVKMF